MDIRFMIFILDRPNVRSAFLIQHPPVQGQLWGEVRKRDQRSINRASPIKTVAVRPVTRRPSSGSSSSLIRTGTRCASRTQLNVGLTDASKSLLVPRL